MANNGSEAQVLKKSVTAEDYNVSPMQNILMHFIQPGVSTTPDLPAFWSPQRDYVLYGTLYRESMWAAAIYLAITKQVAESFEVDSDIPLRARRAQELFLGMDGGRGWVSGLSRHLQAYLLTGNGGPVEIVRASGAPGSRILGLIPLDTFRTIRTGDPDVPLLYRDRRGYLHEIKVHEAFILSDSPDQSDLWYGIGHCSSERSYNAISKLEYIERYIRDKVSGQRALALDFINGVIDTQIRDAKTAAQAEAQAKGIVQYMGSVIIALMGDTPPQHVRINLAELPDGFNRKEEFDIAILTYARSIGIPVQDLQPLSGQGLGTGAQSVVLDEAAKGQGRAAWRKDWAHAVNQYVLDDKTTFHFSEKDIRDREREAKIRIDEAGAIKTWIDTGAITPAQALQLGVDRDQLPKEFITVDVTPGDTLSDTEKPETEEVTPEETPPEIPVVPPVPETAVTKNTYPLVVKVEKDYEQETELVERIAAQGDVLQELFAQMSQTQSALNDDLRLKSESQAGALRETLSALHDTIRRVKALGGRVDGLQASASEKQRASGAVLDALRQSLAALKNVPDVDRKLLSQVAREAAEIVALKSVTTQSGQTVIRTEVVEKDEQGRPSRVRRTLANGETQLFGVQRDAEGRTQTLEAERKD